MPPPGATGPDHRPAPSRWPYQPIATVPGRHYHGLPASTAPSLAVSDTVNASPSRYRASSVPPGPPGIGRSARRSSARARPCRPRGRSSSSSAGTRRACRHTWHSACRWHSGSRRRRPACRDHAPRPGTALATRHRSRMVQPRPDAQVAARALRASYFFTAPCRPRLTP